MSAEQETPPSKPARPPKWVWVGVIVATLLACVGIGLAIRFRHGDSSKEPTPSPVPVEKPYQRIFDAYGGQAGLDKWKCVRIKYDTIDDIPGRPHSESTQTETFWAPGKSRFESHITFNGLTKRSTIGSNGKMEWVVTPEGQVAVRPTQTVGRSEHLLYIRFYHPFYLLQQGQRVSVKGDETRPDGRHDSVVLIDSSKPEAGECRVDQGTQLLRDFRGLVKLQETGEFVPGRYEFSDYQKTDGGPVPRLITMYQRDRKIRELQFTSVEFRTDFGSEEFDPPTR